MKGARITSAPGRLKPHYTTGTAWRWAVPNKLKIENKALYDMLQYLKQSLDEDPHPINVGVFLQSLVDQIDEHTLMRWRCQMRVQKLLVKCTVESEYFTKALNHDAIVIIIQCWHYKFSILKFCAKITYTFYSCFGSVVSLNNK